MPAGESEQASSRSSGPGWRLGLATAAIVLLGLGFYVGVAVEMGRESDAGNSAREGLVAADLGSASAGRKLFVSKGCAMCHQFEGRGGTDAPPLDFMTGRLAAVDIAGMSGTLWNHSPAMHAAFTEEGVPFPTFASGEMEDLIAYLHGGGPAPDVPKEAETGMSEGK